MNTIIKPYSSPFLNPSNTHNPHAVIKLFFPLLILTAGTGGVMTAHSTAEALNRCHYPRIHVEPSVAEQVDMRSPAEHVANIRDGFVINMSDLAAVLGVTRPTVYAWLEGQEPKTETIMRIQRLSHAADEIKQADIPRLDKLMHRPILNGRSLLDILKTDEDPLSALATLKTIAEKEAQTRHVMKGPGKHLRSLDDVLAESSVPIYGS